MLETYLFLDIDGVLNSREAYKEQYKGKSQIHVICPKLVARLNRIVKELGCKVVLSSIWRFNGLKMVQDKLDENNAEFQLIGRTSIYGRGRDRGEQIQEYMDEHNITAEQIVILDDDSDMVHLMPRLIQTTFEKGLQDEHVKKAIALFK